MPVFTAREGHVGLITLSRPQKRNAWGQDYNDSLPAIFKDWANDPAIRCVVVTGDEEGGAFSAGADMKNPATHSERTPQEFVETLSTPRSSVSALPDTFSKPVIAAVNGYAIGNGCIFSYSADLIIASERAEWRLPQASLGIMPAYGGALRLARLVGKSNAMRMVLGFPVSAETALNTGLAQWVVPHEQLMIKAMEVAERISALPPLAVRLTKESMNQGLDAGTLANAAIADVYRVSVLERTQDAKEAHSAWREGRAPTFTGS